MKQKEYRIGPGAASLLLVVVVVSLSVLGLLALMSARSDHKLAERSLQFTVSEYRASAGAERSLAELDGILAACADDAQDQQEYLRLVLDVLPENMYMDGSIVYWEQASEHGRTLYCGVEIQPLGAAQRYLWKQHMFAADETAELFE